VAALSLSLYLGVLGALRRSGALIWAMCGGTAIGVGLYLLYGLNFDAALFRAVLREEIWRPNELVDSGFGGFYSLLLVPRIVNTPFIYPPFLLGLFTLLWNVAQRRQLELSLQTLLYAAGLAFLLGRNEAYGWYLIPAYPLLSFGIADFVRRTWDEENRQSLWIWFLFSVPYQFGMLVEHRPGDRMLGRHAFLLALIAIPFLVLPTGRLRKAFRPGFVVLVVLQCIGDVWHVMAR